MMEPEVIVDVPGELAVRFRERFEAAAHRAMAGHGYFAMAIPGGSVADRLLPALVRARVDWSRVEVFWGDERAVPPADPDSNYAVAKGGWLDQVRLDPARIHRMHAEDPDLDAAADAYAHDLTRTLGGRPLDLVLLGMGPDGHVCSLFPGHPALDEPTRTVLPIRDSPKPPPTRLTLTLVALAGAPLVCVAAFGAEKAAAVHDALESPASRLPVALAARGGRHALFLLDPAAAGTSARR
jgi:6-phosphogluconolactonase